MQRYWFKTIVKLVLISCEYIINSFECQAIGIKSLKYEWEF